MSLERKIIVSGVEELRKVRGWGRGWGGVGGVAGLG